MQLPETPKMQVTPEEMLEVVQQLAYGSEKAERTAQKFLDQPERNPTLDIDMDHPDDDGSCV